MKQLLSTFTLFLALTSNAVPSVIEIPDDHQIDGYEVFYELEGKEAKSLGEALAKSDHGKEIKRIFVYGLRGGASEYERVLAERYYVYHVPIAGCIVSDGIIEGAKSYNKTMEALLFDTYKKDIFEEVRIEVEGNQNKTMVSTPEAALLP